MEKTCTECGAEGAWRKILERDYPERRRERERTVETVYECNSCESQGKHFVHKDGGPDTFSGAME